MICNIDLTEVMKFHEKNINDITIVYKTVSNADKSFIDCDVINVDSNDNIISVGENIGSEKESNINMEIFLMRKDLFIEIIYECIKTGLDRKVKNCIYRNLDKLKVKAYKFDGYLSCINSLEAYYKANMDLLNVRINNELFFDNGPIYTKSKDEGPTKYTKDSNVVNSIIANGCYIEGTVENCIISRRVHIHKDVHLKDCIILQNSTINAHSKLQNVITDKCTNITKGEELKGARNYPLVIERPKIM